MSETSIDNFDERTEELMIAQESAQMAGELGKVNRLEGELRKLFERRYGTAPAVGTAGGPTA